MDDIHVCWHKISYSLSILKHFHWISPLIQVFQSEDVIRNTRRRRHWRRRRLQHTALQLNYPKKNMSKVNAERSHLILCSNMIEQQSEIVRAEIFQPHTEVRDYIDGQIWKWVEVSERYSRWETSEKIKTTNKTFKTLKKRNSHCIWSIN